jgi:hypothetical protein
MPLAFVLAALVHFLVLAGPFKEFLLQGIGPVCTGLCIKLAMDKLR